MVIKAKNGYQEHYGIKATNGIGFISLSDVKINKNCWSDQNFRDIYAKKSGRCDKSLHYNTMETYCSNTPFSIYV